VPVQTRGHIEEGLGYMYILSTDTSKVGTLSNQGNRPQG
jgi:hypothetical protein